MASLTGEQIRRFQEQGFVNRIPVLDADEVVRFRGELERVEREQNEQAGGLWTGRDFRPWQEHAHPLEDWFVELAIHPRVLDAVESLLGPDILVRNADIFIKEVISEEDVSWHLDTAETGPLADEMLTAWIGLTDSTVQNGAMEFVVGTHREPLPHPPKSKDALTLTDDAVAAIPPERVVANAMRAGEMSMHHFRLVHQSQDNWTDERRIAYVVRYMTPRVTPEIAECGTALLARGQDRHRHFTQKPNFPVTWADDSYVVRAQTR